MVDGEVQFDKVTGESVKAWSRPRSDHFKSWRLDKGDAGVHQMKSTVVPMRHICRDEIDCRYHSHLDMLRSGLRERASSTASLTVLRCRQCEAMGQR